MLDPEYLDSREISAIKVEKINVMIRGR